MQPCHGDPYLCSCGEGYFRVNFAYDRPYRGFTVKRACCEACGKAPEGRGQWQKDPKLVMEWERLGITKRTYYRRILKAKAIAIGKAMYDEPAS